DNNGVVVSGAVASQTITLGYNLEPDGTPDVDGDADADTNLTLDFGFVANQPPVANDDSVTVAEDSGANDLTAELLLNDTDPENDTKTITSATQGTFGAVSVVAGVLTYTPNGDYNGSDSFTYTISDGNGNTDTATVSVTVTSVNDPPVVDLNGAGGGTSATLAFTEGDGSTAIAPSATVTDDSSDFSGGSLVVDLTTVGTGDMLGVLAGNGITINFGTQTIAYNAVDIASYAITNSGATWTFTFNAAADLAGVEALIRQVAFSNQNDNQVSGDRTVDYTLTDGDGDTGTVATATVSVTAVDDAPVAQPDAISTAENVTGTGDLFANNGSGPDTDAEGDTMTISAVSGGTVGVEFALASGALLTVNSDGTYTYKPNGQFNWLTDNTSGAVNTSTVGDTFQYTLTGGNTVTVTVTVTGVAGPGDLLMGDGTNNVINGTGDRDHFRLQQGGNDTANGNAGDDIFYFGGAFTGDDIVDGDGGGKDVIVLQGNYSLTFSATNFTGIEAISLQSGGNTFYGDTANNFYDFDITTDDANVGAGATLIVNGQSLRAGEDFTFDGSAESNGKFLVFGGHGVDDLTGGDGNDIFVFEGTRWGASDSVNGGDGRDAVVITAGNGLTHIDFGPTSLIGVESVTVSNQYSSTPAATPDYEFVLDNGNVAAGATLIVNGATLADPGQTISVDGSAETDGKLILFGGAGTDVLIGGDQADTLYGGGNADDLTGGTGPDVFRYDNVSDSTTAARDEILDFASGDLIDLSRIDADSTTGGNQAFNFIGTDPFSNVAGELRFENVAGTTWLIQGDTDGIGGADFEIIVVIADLHPITDGDFIL
ncbi:MAG TPA: Ig-like domain-containing protein, partial [Allosphingosinicella sp.]|nr:Ig-like domain-containing protein [Allosphingosinicella sp.]